MDDRVQRDWRAGCAASNLVVEAALGCQVFDHEQRETIPRGLAVSKFLPGGLTDVRPRSIEYLLVGVGPAHKPFLGGGLHNAQATACAGCHLCGPAGELAVSELG